MRKLRRVTGPEKWIAGVCAGVAYAVGAPVWLVRLGWALLVLSYGTGVALYVLLWIFMPAWDATPPDYAERTGD